MKKFLDRTAHVTFQTLGAIAIVGMLCVPIVVAYVIAHFVLKFW